MNIGFVTYWGWGRGQAYVSKNLVKVLLPYHNVNILKRGTNAIESEFPKINGIITENKGYDISEKFLKEWISDRKLDVIMFMEEQWPSMQTSCNLVKVAKSTGVKIYGCPMWEVFNPEDLETYKLYDKIVLFIKCAYNKMMGYGLNNIIYLPWGVDLKEFKYKEKLSGDVVTFYIPGGWGGMYDRKNIDSVVKAFNLLNNENARLVISIQKQGHSRNDGNIKIISGDLSRETLISLYQDCDVVVMPSKWEGLGLTFAEAFSCGKPVITVDAPPMNEFVKANINGFLAEIKKIEHYPGVHVQGHVVDEKSLKNQMSKCFNPMILNILKGNARRTAMELYDWNKNKLKFIELFK